MILITSRQLLFYACSGLSAGSCTAVLSAQQNSLLASAHCFCGCSTTSLHPCCEAACAAETLLVISLTPSVQVTQSSSGLLKDCAVQQLLSFHSGAIVGLATSPYSHLAITAGADGTIRLHDYWYVISFVVCWFNVLGTNRGPTDRVHADHQEMSVMSETAQSMRV